MFNGSFYFVDLHVHMNCFNFRQSVENMKHLNDYVSNLITLNYLVTTLYDMYFHNVFFGYNRSDLCDIFTFIIRILVYLMTRCTMFNYECKFTLEKWSVFNIVLYFDFLNSFSLNLWYSFFGNVRRLRHYDFHASSLLYYTLYQEKCWSLHPDKGKGGAVSIWNEIQYGIPFWYIWITYFTFSWQENLTVKTP